jgi:hypothetical protein
MPADSVHDRSNDLRRVPQGQRAATRARPPWTAAALAAVLLSIAGCASISGMGGGEIGTADAAQPALFSWTSDDGGRTGEMVATLPEATYRGPFVQISDGVQRAALPPLWDGWAVGWSDWAGAAGQVPLGPYDIEQFVTRYSGKVVANLQSRRGGLLRCRLELAAPRRGLSGGAKGQCQRPGEAAFDVEF